eukprot:TRINITY_DN7718_c0_g1_i2.p1 TRINITY_DN7718_c0_g1~~TRINITY_DN7718_c0_g1_i2.p1  ORF type:complete len:536 (-),score=68.94 TRINITY_DN7718_c0_g1_i2:47-1654(-)
MWQLLCIAVLLAGLSASLQGCSSKDSDDVGTSAATTSTTVMPAPIATTTVNHSAATANMTLVEALEYTFEQWRARFGKTYKDNATKQAAFSYWKTMETLINSVHDDPASTFRMAHNKFSDGEPPKGHDAGSMPQLPMGKTLTPNQTSGGRRLQAVPASVDWVAAGKVIPVKDQQQCSSCWAFAAVAAMESAYAIENSATPISFSEQQLVACNTGTSSFSNGQPVCSAGGNTANAFLYAGASYSMSLTVGFWNYGSFAMTLAQAGWLPQVQALMPAPMRTESDYPYTAGPGGTQTCDLSTVPTSSMLTVGGFAWVQTETDLLAAVVQQPVALGLYAGPQVQGYASGVLNQCGNAPADHAVVVVGYGVEGGSQYWLIKNSWGTDWGLSGYMQILRGQNMCGIGNNAMMYPTGTALTSNTVIPAPTTTTAPPASASWWANPATTTCSGGNIDVNGQATIEKDGASHTINFGAPAGSPCSPSCSSGPCPAYPSGGYPYCYYTSSLGSWCALVCGVNGWTCPAGMSCSTTSGEGTCVYDA